MCKEEKKKERSLETTHDIAHPILVVATTSLASSTTDDNIGKTQRYLLRAHLIDTSSIDFNLLVNVKTRDVEIHASIDCHRMFADIIINRWINIHLEIDLKKRQTSSFVFLLEEEEEHSSYCQLRIEMLTR